MNDGRFQDAILSSRPMLETDFNYVVTSTHEHKIVSYLGCSGVTEDGEAFMSMNGLQISFLARVTHVFQVRGRIFMSWM